MAVGFHFVREDLFACSNDERKFGENFKHFFRKEILFEDKGKMGRKGRGGVVLQRSKYVMRACQHTVSNYQTSCLSSASAAFSVKFENTLLCNIMLIVQNCPELKTCSVLSALSLPFQKSFQLNLCTRFTVGSFQNTCQTLLEHSCFNIVWREV